MCMQELGVCAAHTQLYQETPIKLELSIIYN